MDLKKQLRGSYFSRIILQNAFISLVNAVVSKGVLAVLMFFAARRYGPETFGIITIAFSLVMVASIFASFGTGNYGIREVAAARERRDELLNSLMGFQIVNAAVAMLILWAVALFTLGAKNESGFVMIMAATLIPERIDQVVTISFYGRERFGVPLLISAVYSVGLLIFGLPLVLAGAPILRVGVVLLLMEIVSAVVAQVLHNRLIGPIRPVFHPAMYARIFLASLPYFLILILSAVHMRIGVFMIRGFLGSATVGLYGIATGIVTVASLLQQSVLTGMFPSVARIGEAEGGLNASRALRTLLQPFVLGVVLALLIIFLAPPVVPWLLGDSYAASVPPLRMLSWFLPFIFVSSTAMRMMIATGGTSTVMKILAVNCVVNIAANFLLIPRAGITGAAIAAVLSAAVSAGQCLWIFRRRAGRLPA